MEHYRVISPRSSSVNTGWSGGAIFVVVETGGTGTQRLNHDRARRTGRTAAMNLTRSVKERTNLTIWCYRKVACCHVEVRPPVPPVPARAGGSRRLLFRARARHRPPAHRVH